MSRTRRKHVSVKKSIYLFCEGETEANYFKMLKQKYRSFSVSVLDPSRSGIKIKSLDRSGEELINKAINDKKKNKQIKANDPIYVVFDRDKHDKKELLRCKKLARENNITILFSSICFEIWILMHFEPVFSSYSSDELFKKLSGPKYFDQDYKDFKGVDIRKLRPFLFDNVQFAKDNADKLYKIHHDMINNDPFTNVGNYLKEIFQTNEL